MHMDMIIVWCGASRSGRKRRCHHGSVHADGRPAQTCHFTARGGTWRRRRDWQPVSGGAAICFVTGEARERVERCAIGHKCNQALLLIIFSPISCLCMYYAQVQKLVQHSSAHASQVQVTANGHNGSAVVESTRPTRKRSRTAT